MQRRKRAAGQADQAPDAEGRKKIEQYLVFADQRQIHLQQAQRQRKDRRCQPVCSRAAKEDRQRARAQTAAREQLPPRRAAALRQMQPVGQLLHRKGLFAVAAADGVDGLQLSEVRHGGFLDPPRLRNACLVRKAHCQYDAGCDDKHVHPHRTIGQSHPCERLLDAAHVRAVGQHTLAKLQKRMEHQRRILHILASSAILFLVYHGARASASKTQIDFFPLLCFNIGINR